MGESIAIPIFIGIAINVVFFLILLFIFKQNALKATNITLVAFIFVLAGSFIIGSWLGMGIGIVSIGMLVGSLALYIFNSNTFKKLLAKNSL